MSKLKYLSLVALAVTTIAAPAMAREKAVAQQSTQIVDGRVCVAAPQVGAFATAPWTNGNVPCEP
jgi:hypothetical protein